MGRLPAVPGREAARAFARNWLRDQPSIRPPHQASENPSPHRHLSIPDHKELSKGLLRGLIRDSGLTVQQFTDLL